MKEINLETVLESLASQLATSGTPKNLYAIQKTEGNIFIYEADANGDISQEEGTLQVAIAKGYPSVKSADESVALTVLTWWFTASEVVQALPNPDTDVEAWAYANE